MSPAISLAGACRRSRTATARKSKPTGAEPIRGFYEKRWLDPSGDVGGGELVAGLGDRACGEPAGESDRAVSRIPLTLDPVG